MSLTPAEAISRVNEPVVVEMFVKRAKQCPGCLEIFLDSEENYRAPQNLGVAITATGRARFKELQLDDLVGHFKGRTIRVRGVLLLKEDRPQIEVDDPGQIEVMERQS